MRLKNLSITILIMVRILSTHFQTRYSNFSNECLSGVYKTGFAATQAVYDEHVTKLFNGLDKIEKLLSEKRGTDDSRDYLCGSGKGEFTEADVR